MHIHLRSPPDLTSDKDEETLLDTGVAEATVQRLEDIKHGSYSLSFIAKYAVVSLFAQC